MKDEKKLNELRYSFEGFSISSNGKSRNGRSNLGTYREIVGVLNKRSEQITRRIADELQEKIRESIEVNVSIEFRTGSIEWEGFIEILDWGARLSGSIAFIHFLQRRIQYVVNRAIERELPDFYTDNDFDIETNVKHRPIQSVPPTAPYEGNSLNRGFDIFSRKEVLIGITMLNLILIFGGNIYNAVQIDSIRANYEKSIEEIEKSESKYIEAKNKLSTVENQVRAQMGNAIGILESRYGAEIEKRIISLDTLQKYNMLNLNSKANQLTHKLTDFERKLLEGDSKSGELNDRLRTLNSTLEVQNTKLKELVRSNFTIRFDNFWNHTDWFFKLFVIFGGITMLSALFMMLVWSFRLLLNR